MTTRIVFLERQLATLREYLFDRDGVEGAAFALCGESTSKETSKLICHAVVPIADEDYVRREPYGLTISSRALSRITKLAKHENLSIVFAHSHPGGMAEFSAQDDREEEQLIPFLQSRIPGRVHGTLVLSETGVVGRLYSPDRTPVDAIACIGERFQYWRMAGCAEPAVVFDRQVRAFGRDIQSLLSSLHIGIVGLGGTGSPLAEQLARLGIGKLSLFDGDRLDVTNVNRVYGSAMVCAGELKVDIARGNVQRIGLATTVVTIPEHITYEESARRLRDCDIIFGCTDRQLPRAILTQVSLKYSIPVIDLGVLIDSENGRLQGIHGRITSVFAGEACLLCRGRISPEAIRVESLSEQDRDRQRAEGYAPELDEPAPAVIAFTSAVSSLAVAEFIHRLTGFRGGRSSSETLISFDENRIRTNRVEPRSACVCTDEASWGRADEDPYLGLVWPSRTR